MPFAAVSLYALHRSNRAVALRTLNAQRFELVLDRFWPALLARTHEAALRALVLRAHVHRASLVAPPHAVAAALVPTPHDVAPHERLVLLGRPTFSHGVDIAVGPVLEVPMAALVL